MKDTTKAWLIIGAILLGSAEPSPAVTPVPVFEGGHWSWASPPPKQRESDADFYSRQNYYMLQQQQYENYLQKRQYEQDRRNFQMEEKQRLMMEAFD